MSEENVEIVRRIYEQGMLDRNPERLLPLLAPEVEYVNPPDAVEPGIRRGLSGMARALQSLGEAFDSSRNELRELFDAGASVIAAVDFCTRSRGSEAEVVQEEVHTWTFRNGQIVRFEWGRNLNSALEAAGLSE